MMTAEELKNSILRMAVEGKLTKQNPADNSASEFIKNTQNRKKALIGQKIFKKAKPQEKLTDDDLPFEIPENWKWCQVGDLFSNSSGLSYKKGLLSEKSDRMVRILRGGNIGTESYSFKEDDQFIKRDYVDDSLYLKKGYMITPAVTSLNHIGKIGLIDKDYDDVVAGGFVLMLMPYFNNDVASKYFLYVFDTKEHRDACKAITHKSGQAFYNLSREKLMNLPVPVPPLEEMDRIVAKIEELMPLVDQYAAASEKLNKLNATFPNRMKKSILQQAVQGKLVPQDPSDEPASVLLEKIAAEKQKLIQEGKIKKQKKLPAITEDEIPFEIPESWAWVRLGELVTQLGDGIHGTPKYDVNGTHYFINGNNLSNGKIEIKQNTKKVSKEEFEKYTKELNDTTVLVSINGTLGNVAFYNNEPVILGKSACYFNLALQDLKMYIFWLLKSDYFNKYALAQATGTTIKNVSLKAMNNFPVPLPPLQEQRRMVAELKLLKPSVAELRTPKAK